MKFAIPDKLENQDIKDFRKKFSLTQQDLGNLLGLSKKTIEKWEAKDGCVTGAAVTVLKLMDENPNLLEQLRIDEKKYKYRFYYMAGNSISTIIDVDYSKREVAYKNYTNNVNRKAFGTKKEVTFEDFEEFLKSRCFPETRDNMKLMLRSLNIPFYDPFMIVEKTEGRMAEDNYWIRIER